MLVLVLAVALVVLLALTLTLALLLLLLVLLVGVLVVLLAVAARQVELLRPAMQEEEEGVNNKEELVAKAVVVSHLEVLQQQIRTQF